MTDDPTPVEETPVSLDADLDAQLQARADDPDWADVSVTVNGNLVVLRFTQMDGLEWAELAALCPPNLRSGFDKEYGYNMRAMSMLAGPISGVRRIDDQSVILTDEQWKKLFRALSGGEHRMIGNALYHLNEWAPGQAIIAAKKALAAESAKNSSSPVPSASPAAD